MNTDSPRLIGTQTPSAADRALADLLVEREKLSLEECERSIRLCVAEELDLHWLLTRLGLVAERDLADALSVLHAAPIVAPEEYPETPLYEDRLPPHFLRDSRVVPIADTTGGLIVAMAFPQDEFAVKSLELACERNVIRRTGLGSEILAVVDRLYGIAGHSGNAVTLDEARDAADTEEDIKHLRDLASEAPVIRVVNQILQRAIELKASDIHVEPFDRDLIVRYRIDGGLRETQAPSYRSAAAIISRLKLIARLDIAERRLPQDGRIQLRLQGKEIDLRVSTVPTMHGESVVLRILDRDSVTLDFDALGLEPDTLSQLRQILATPHGILLVTGPTGSGKTTTLYTALKELNIPDRKILTVEDPVEYHLRGVNQIQVKPQIGLGFAAALRSILRQDPDVIMIGEMRDCETARIAVQSALTGHVVLSTLHTNDAGSSITRLLDMGIEPFLVTSTVRGVIAQRLVRRLCPHCREAYCPPSELIAELEGYDAVSVDVTQTLYRPAGCSGCGDTGYRGRVAILELMMMSDRLRSLTLQRTDSGTIERTASELGMRTLFADGMRKALRGVTSLEEVLRVTQDSGS